MTLNRKIISIALTVVTFLSCIVLTAYADNTVKEPNDSVELFECICGKLWFDSNDRDYCIDSHKDADGRFSCNNCRKSFINADSYKLHEYDHIKNNEKTDPGEIKIPSGEIENPMADSPSSFKCYCGKYYLSITDYNYCLDSHRNPAGYFVCQNCGRQFINPQIYMLHESVHIRNDNNIVVTESSYSGPEQLPLELECVCSKQYVSIVEYNHCLDSHRDPNGYFVCEFCDAKFENPQNYKLHIDFCATEKEKTVFDKIIDTIKTFFEKVIDFFQNLFISVTFG